MIAKTLTRADLTDAVFKEVGLPRQECSELVETVLDTIADRLRQDSVVKLSSFGTFALREKSERIGRNPKTGEEVAITPRRVLSFRASHVLKDKVNRAMTAHKS